MNVPEMALGTRETFVYEHCQACGSLQIAAVPAHLEQYYPPSQYYAYRSPSRGVRASIRHLARVAWWGAALFSPEPLFAVLCALPQVGSRMRTNRLRALRGQRLARGARIADVGGGAGEMLQILRSLGFRHLTCVDPYSPVSGAHDGIDFLKGCLQSAEERFDLIMYHHSLEHVPDIEGELRTARAHLAPGGLLLVRLPLLPNEAFATYGPHWAEIDAPRHLHIPSRAALRTMAARCALDVVASGSDTQELEFWASEDYARGLSRRDVEGARTGVRAFCSTRMRAYRRRADRLNAQDRGGRGWFLFRAAKG
jgi:SAM-dependent methyltransferase